MTCAQIGGWHSRPPEGTACIATVHCLAPPWRTPCTLHGWACQLGRAQRLSLQPGRRKARALPGPPVVCGTGSCTVTERIVMHITGADQKLQHSAAAAATALRRMARTRAWRKQSQHLSAPAACCAWRLWRASSRRWAQVQHARVAGRKCSTQPACRLELSAPAERGPLVACGLARLPAHLPARQPINALWELA